MANSEKIQFDLEYILKASPAIVYQFLTTPDILVRWFCDSCDVTDEVYTFEWDGSEEYWEMIDDIQEERIRFHIEDSGEDEYIEFRMYRSDITNETILEITGFCDDDEVDEESIFWTDQVRKLKSACGG